MALVRAARKALSPVMASAQYTITRGMSMEGVRGFNEHEKTVEDLYFTKEDQRLFGKLMSKVKQQSDVVDKHAAEGVKAAELSALKPIVDKYKMSADDVDKILAWKHTHY